jgi:hypothetical protein
VGISQLFKGTPRAVPDKVDGNSPSTIFIHHLMVKVLHSSKKYCRWVLASSLALPQNGIDCTIVIRPVLISKLLFPTSTLGPASTWSVDKGD